MDGIDVINNLLDDATKVAVSNNHDQIPAQQVQATSSVKTPGGIPAWALWSAGGVGLFLLGLVIIKAAKG